jgi:acid-sensing ion channel, other
LDSSTDDQNGLKIYLKYDEIYKHDVRKYLSFMVHSPYELPGSYEIIDIYDFDYDFDLKVLITPEIFRTDENLRSYEPKERGCYFSDEKKLKYFKIYTKRNCEFECFSENMKNDPILNCTPYFAVRDATSKVCDYRHEYHSRQQSFYALRDLAKCGCLDECNSIRYKVEIISYILKNDTETMMEFMFKDIDVVPLRRYQPLTFSDFLAQSGQCLLLAMFV